MGNSSKFALIGMSESLMQEVRKNNIRVSTLTPSTLVTDLAYSANLVGDAPERMMHPEDLAEFMVAQLKLNRRMFIKEAGMWSTNP